MDVSAFFHGWLKEAVIVCSGVSGRSGESGFSSGTSTGGFGSHFSFASAVKLLSLQGSCSCTHEKAKNVNKKTKYFDFVDFILFYRHEW
jgi:hypothetical protein